MLKKFAILLFCGFLTLSIHAQDFGGGIILGLSTSQVGGDDLGGFNKAGLLAGVFANKAISPLISFQMEMTYIQKGSNNPNMNDAEDINNYLKEDISSYYFEMPLLLKYHQSEILKILRSNLCQLWCLQELYVFHSGHYLHLLLFQFRLFLT